MAREAMNRRTFLGSSATSAALVLGGCGEGLVGETSMDVGAERRLGSVGVDEVTPAFSVAEYQDRVQRVRQRMERDQIDLLWVTMPESMCYLHGLELAWYQSNSPKAWLPLSGTAVHVDHETPIHFDSRGHSGSLQALSVSTDNRFLRGGAPSIVKELEAEGWLGGTVGLEYWSYRPSRAVSEMFQEAFQAAGCHVVDGSDVLRQVRVVKSTAEITVMEEAAQICDIGLQAIAETLRPGVTELEVYSEAIRAMAYAGGEMPALLQAATTGRGSHAVPTRRIFREGDFVFADLCGVVRRYHANRSHNFFLGDPPTDVVKHYEKNAGAFEALSNAGRAGTRIADVCAALRDYYREVGLEGGAFGYELGISFPPDWVGPFLWSFATGDEAPRVVGLGDDPSRWSFQHGMVTNYESTLGWNERTRRDRFTVIDTIVYEETGARRLSSLPLQITAIG